MSFGRPRTMEFASKKSPYADKRSRTVHFDAPEKSGSLDKWEFEIGDREKEPKSPSNLVPSTIRRTRWVRSLTETDTKHPVCLKIRRANTVSLPVECLGKSFDDLMLGVRDTASVEIEDLSSSKECSPVKTVIAEESLAAKRTENDHRSEEGPVLDVERNDECHSFCIFEVQGTPATKIDAHKEGDCEDTTLAFQSSGVSAGDQRLSDNNEMNFGEKILSFQEQARNSSIDWVDSEVTISNPAACKSPNNGIDLSILAESSEMDNAVEVKISPKRCFDEIGEGDKVSATAFNQARSLSSDTSGHVATQSEDMPSVGPAEHTDQLLAVKIKNENSETEFTNEEETLGCVSVFQMIPECASQSTSREQTVEIVSSVEKSQLILQASLGCRFGQYPETSGTTGTSLTRETTELEGLPNQEADEKATKIELVETTASQGLPTSPMKLAPLKCDYDATCTKSTFALSNPSVHKSLKELIHMANHKCYQVDSSKVQYKAGLSKKKTAGLPHLHERFNFHKR